MAIAPTLAALFELLRTSQGSQVADLIEEESHLKEEELYDADDEESDDEESGYLGILRR